MKTLELNILIVDDHAIFRQMLSKTLEQFRLFNIIHQASDGLKAIEICKSNLISIVLLDINMPNLNGVETAKLIMKMSPRYRPFVIMLTQYNEPQLVLYLFEIGVQGYMIKNCEVEDLQRAITVVLKGDLFYPKEFEHRIKTAIQSNDLFLKNISKEEITMLELLSEGKTNKEIATILGYSVRTIESKRVRMEKKAKVRNAPELIKYAFRAGLLRI
jgi:DNA-binding NarL/FixJ family response regulator